MDKGRYGNAAISGSGMIAGGKYEEVRISGSGKVDGDIEASNVHVSGSAQFTGSVAASGGVHVSGSASMGGNVAAHAVKVSGSCRFAGNVEADEYRVSGSAEVRGHLHGRSIHSSGSLSCGSSVRAEEIRISGHMGADGDVESEMFRVNGGFKVKGLLNASEIDVSMNGLCYAREIGCDRIEVRLFSLNIFWRFVVWLTSLFGRGSQAGLRSEQIEGTDIQVEWTEAGFVRGQRVYIGKGCHIDLVEYTEKVYVDPEARVKEVRQMI